MQCSTKQLCGVCPAAAMLPSSCTGSLVSGRLLLRSLGTIGFRNVTEINPGVNDHAHGESKRPSNCN